MNGCVHCYVSGRVQGVFFRAETREQARLLGLTGWVRNLPDGRVEIMACGEPRKVQQLCVWLSQGPDFAHVTDVQCAQVELQTFDDFKVR